MVCHHIILKKAEVIYLPAFIERYKENRMFIVEEFGTDSNDKDQGLHYHILIEIDKTEARLRADVNKNVRKAKTHGVISSVGRKPDVLMQGLSWMHLPKIMHNSWDLSEDKIKELHDQYWEYRAKMFQDPDIKETKVLDELVDKCRDVAVTEDQVIEFYYNLVKTKGGKKSFANKQVGQAYIRTALSFSKNEHIYGPKIRAYYKSGLWG